MIRTVLPSASSLHLIQQWNDRFSAGIGAIGVGTECGSAGPAEGGVRSDVGGLAQAAVFEVLALGDDQLPPCLDEAVRGVFGLISVASVVVKGEAFIDHLRSTTVKAVSTARSYEIAISLFVEYLLDPRYGWASVCLEHFGDAPQAIFHEGNTIAHKVEHEADPQWMSA